MWQNSLILTWQSLYSHTAYLLIDKVCFCFSLCCCCCCYCVCFLMFKWEDWQFWLKNILWVIPAKKFLTFLPQFSSHPCDLCFLAIDQEIKEKKKLNSKLRFIAYCRIKYNYTKRPTCTCMLTSQYTRK